MGNRAELVQKDIDVEVLAIEAIKLELEEVTSPEHYSELIIRLNYHENRVFFFAFALESAKRDDEQDRLVELGRKYGQLLELDEAVQLTTLGDGKHIIVCTSKALVVLSAAVNYYGSDIEEGEQEANVLSVAQVGVMTDDDVFTLAEEWYTNIPSNFDVNGEPADEQYDWEQEPINEAVNWVVDTSVQDDE